MLVVRVAVRELRVGKQALDARRGGGRGGPPVRRRHVGRGAGPGRGEEAAAEGKDAAEADETEGPGRAAGAARRGDLFFLLWRERGREKRR